MSTLPFFEDLTTKAQRLLILRNETFVKNFILTVSTFGLNSKSFLDYVSMRPCKCKYNAMNAINAIQLDLYVYFYIIFVCVFRFPSLGPPYKIPSNFPNQDKD